MAIFSRECKTSALLGVSSCVMVLAALVKWVIVPIVIENQIKINLELIEGTQGYDTWVILIINDDRLTKKFILGTRFLGRTAK